MKKTIYPGLFVALLSSMPAFSLDANQNIIESNKQCKTNIALVEQYRSNLEEVKASGKFKKEIINHQPLFVGKDGHWSLEVEEGEYNGNENIGSLQLDVYRAKTDNEKVKIVLDLIKLLAKNGDTSVLSKAGNNLYLTTTNNKHCNNYSDLQGIPVQLIVHMTEQQELLIMEAIFGEKYLTSEMQKFTNSFSVTNTATKTKKPKEEEDDDEDLRRSELEEFLYYLELDMNADYFRHHVFDDRDSTDTGDLRLKVRYGYDTDYDGGLDVIYEENYYF